MKTLLAVFLAVGLARAEGASPIADADGHPLHPAMLTMDMLYNSCKLSAGMFLNPNVGMPNPRCQYPLGDVVIAQKIKNGYLFAAITTSGRLAQGGAMFLKTPADLPESTRFTDDIPIMVKWTGTYEYEALDGFKKTVWAFEPVAAQ